MKNWFKTINGLMGKKGIAATRSGGSQTFVTRITSCGRLIWWDRMNILPGKDDITRPYR